MQKTLVYFGIGLAGAVLLAGIFIFWQGIIPIPFLPTNNNATSTTASTTSTTIGDVSFMGANGNVELVSIGDVAVPSLDGEIKIASDIPESVRKQLRTNEEILIQKIKKDPLQLDLWIELGNNRRIAKDYDGAIEAWNYVSKVSPTDYVAFNNLGNIYMSILKDYPKAEVNFKQAIAVRADIVDVYRNLFDLYCYYYKTDTNAARSILELGIKNNPKDTDLKSLLEEYNKTHVQ